MLYMLCSLKCSGSCRVGNLDEYATNTSIMCTDIKPSWKTICMCCEQYVTERVMYTFHRRPCTQFPAQSTRRRRGDLHARLFWLCYGDTYAVVFSSAPFGVATPTYEAMLLNGMILRTRTRAYI